MEPEILDGLAEDDPRAVRSRGDLRFINLMMGGERWIVRAVSQFSQATTVVDLGAGEGRLANRIKRAYPQLDVVAVDLHARPPGLDTGIRWLQGDALDGNLHFGRDAIVVANLFLHHFGESQLEQLGQRFSDVGGWLCHEPHRSAGALFWGRLLLPFVGSVTRHDMMVSIRAGFVPDELRKVIGTSGDWSEAVSTFGGLRSKVVCV
ncbi:methyltransferase domain-containing protein [Sulfuriroseicoccus oceanibius]|uniref:O-methyltransferase C-terminal domain-containing protein n=1 Tax=Sulfuriroseicoccus oceanibius TaxID=2707525 RepID=A0A7T7F397_9BACT|nr:methyltransferase domain-containing protein [Sulfuriroseicoccus oceanibius]QQL45918.1 hypothetical protein G3M56_004885 [Sulfuriroseicoccus oceanibius]